MSVHSDEQKSLTRDTTDGEMQRIATRLEEAAAAAAAGEFGFTVEEAEATEATSLAEREEFAGEEDLAGPEVEPSEAARKSPSLQTACRRRSPRPRQEGVSAGLGT